MFTGALSVLLFVKTRDEIYHGFFGLFPVLSALSKVNADIMIRALRFDCALVNSAFNAVSAVCKSFFGLFYVHVLPSFVFNSLTPCPLVMCI